MKKAFDILKPNDRSLLWLAYIEGYSHKEIADIMGLKAKSVRVLLFRLRTSFAELLRVRGYAGEEGA
jgi:RNA polymerase sigma-70 factor (ECF subfamily)